MKKPILKEFYSGTLSESEINIELDRIRNSQPKKIDKNTLNVILVLLIWPLLIYYFIDSMWFFGFYLIMGLPSYILASIISWILSELFDVVEDEKNPSIISNPFFDELLNDLSNIEAYKRSYKIWQNYKTETGEAYWQSLRGENLEKATALLFKRFDWINSLTKTSGDGGIDLVIEKLNRKIFIQCKGHQKPIGVGAIRDAAGVKYQKNVEFIVIGPSDFTKGAKDFAKSVGIELLNTRDLVKIAQNGY